MQTYAAMKEAHGEQTLALSTIFYWHQQFTQGRASASLKPKSGRLVVTSTETTVNTIGTMLGMMVPYHNDGQHPSIFPKPRCKRLFSLVSFLQFLQGCTFILLRKMFVRAFYLRYRAYFFTGDVTNSGLLPAFFTISIRCVPVS